MQQEPEHPTWLIRVCGQVRVERVPADGHPAVGAEAAPVVVVGGQQARATLALLAVERRAVLRDEIADLLWGDVVLPDHWPNAVRVVLSKLRRALADLGLPGEVVASTAGTVRLQLPGGWDTDLDRATRLLEQAQHGLDARPAAAAIEAAAARALLSGQVLPEVNGGWARRLAERVAHLWTEAARVEVAAHLARGAPGAAAVTAEQLVTADPLDEAAHHLLIEAMLADGRYAAARKAFQRLEKELADELGIEPAAATRALIDQAGRLDRSPKPAPTTHPQPTAGSALLGRGGELAELDQLWRTVIGGRRPAVAVIGGPSGIGKTRLAREFTGRVRAAGGQVLWGTCYADSGLPYEPILAALGERLSSDRALPSDPTPGPALSALLGRADPADRAGVTRIRRVLAGFTSPAAARSVVFAELRSMVGALATRPTVWVIDDLQWASADTVAFLDLLIDRLAAPLLLVVATRTMTPQLANSLAGWQRAVLAVRTIDLAPLTATELMPLIAGLPATATGAQDAQTVADLLHRRTGGHPFLVLETVQHAVSTGSLGADIPAGARSWTSLRAAALDPEVGNVLDLASVIGLRVSVQVLTEAGGRDPDLVIAALEELADKGFLYEATDAERFDFAHQITREVIYERIGGTRRARLHRKVAEYLERSGEPIADSATIAHHYLRSGPGTIGRAVGFAVAAAERSLAVGAWGLAQSQLLEVSEVATTPDLQAAAQVAMGVALHQQGRGAPAHQTLLRAVALARTHRLAPELAAAAWRMVGRGGRGASADLSDTDRVALLREALTALDDWPLREDARDNRYTRELQRVRVEGELGWAMLFTGSRPERRALALAGLDRLASTPDPTPQVRAQALLNARSVRTTGPELAVRTAEVRAVLALPEAQVSADLRLAAQVYLHEDLLCGGDLVAARAALAEAGAAAQRLASPYWQWAAGTWESLGLAIGGDLGRAQARLDSVTATYAGAAPEVAACQVVQMVCLRLLAGQGAQVLPLITAAADQNPHIPCYRAVLALTAAEIGDDAQAGRALDACAADGFGVLPDDSNRFLALAVLGDVAATLHRADHAATLLELLAPWSGQQVLLNCYGGGGAFWGPVDRVLGRLAVLLGDDRAPDWFESAARAATRIRSPWAVARTAADRRAANAGTVSG